MNTPISLNNKMPFGKHKGKSIAHIIEIDLPYMKWVLYHSSLMGKFSKEVTQKYSWQEYISR